MSCKDVCEVALNYIDEVIMQKLNVVGPKPTQPMAKPGTAERNKQQALWEMYAAVEGLETTLKQYCNQAGGRRTRRGRSRGVRRTRRHR